MTTSVSTISRPLRDFFGAGAAAGAALGSVDMSLRSLEKKLPHDGAIEVPGTCADYGEIWARNATTVMPIWTVVRQGVEISSFETFERSSRSSRSNRSVVRVVGVNDSNDSNDPNDSNVLNV